MAGITAALDCAAEGAVVTLLESRGRLGGAAYSFSRDGLTVDNGQHVFLRCCNDYRAFLTRIGAEQLVSIQPRLAIPVLSPDGRTASLARSGLPAPLHLAGAVLRYPFLSPLQRLSLARAMQALGRVDPDDPTADARSFGEWLAEHGQGPEAVATVWELIARPTLNLVAADASLAQAAYVFQQGLLTDAGAGDVGYARVPLSEIHNVAAAAALARAGIDVRLRHGVNAIEEHAGGFDIEMTGQPTLMADAVVLAVSPDRAVRLLPPAAGVSRHDLAELGSSPIVNLHLRFDRRVLEQPFAVAVHSPVQWIFDRTEAAGAAAGQYLTISLSAAEEELTMTAEQLRERFLPALAALLPAVADAQLENFFVTREHAATFRAAPGSRALRPGSRTALEGLVLAGTWTDTGWPATLEGAVRSGHAAAAALSSAVIDHAATTAVTA